MNDKDRSERRPFGVGDEPQPVFGSRKVRKPGERGDSPRGPAPTDPYPDLRGQGRTESVQPVPSPTAPPREAPPPEPAPDFEPETDGEEMPLTEPASGLSEETLEPGPARRRQRQKAGLFTGARPRPRPRQRQRVPVTLRYLTFLRSMVTMILAGGFFATVFTWWTPASFIPPDSRLALAVAVATQESLAATALPANAPTTALPPATLMPTVVPNRVGIVSGHRGIYPPSGLPDPGAVCDDGTTEQAINEAVAMRVIDLLSGHGYQVDLLDEFDPRLTDYAALAVVSIHADSCQYVNDFATGFKVASFSSSTVPEEDQKLVRCLTERYAETTGLDFHASITFDMTQYHNFREVKPGTPGAIIEIGFMYLDKELLTEQPDVVALGVAQGVLCYLRNELPDS